MNQVACQIDYQGKSGLFGHLPIVSGARRIGLLSIPSVTETRS